MTLSLNKNMYKASHMWIHHSMLSLKQTSVEMYARLTVHCSSCHLKDNSKDNSNKIYATADNIESYNCIDSHILGIQVTFKGNRYSVLQ